ncbi:SRPBCC family protein [Chelativorans sp. YIM 93263]|uniref:SRPBCC family protein n=1 Tax=Chelativorans sp. YIM 93263 TaxID=2906648 RepID=UPI00237837DC|nr:SRPBCC family protein [Chelativorans sp. YIM 93263]
MIQHSAEHATFVIERSLPGRPQHAYRFWSEPEMKRRWASCHSDWQELEYRFDFRIGGSEVSRLKAPDGTVHAVRSYFLDIIEGHRIIYAYEITADDNRISTSLATVEFTPSDTGSLMIFTEQAVFLDGLASAEGREEGTEMGFERLKLEIERDLAVIQ